MKRSARGLAVDHWGRSLNKAFTGFGTCPVTEAKWLIVRARGFQSRDAKRFASNTKITVLIVDNESTISRSAFNVFARKDKAEAEFTNFFQRGYPGLSF